MAKLKSQGEEMVRLERDAANNDPNLEWGKYIKAIFLKEVKGGFVITVLKKTQVRFKATPLSAARNHDWGWSISFKSKITSKENATISIQKMVNSNVENYGYTKIKSKYPF